MAFLSPPAFLFCSLLVGACILVLILLMRPGLPEDRAALGWWVAGDFATVAHRLPPLLQTAVLWPGSGATGGLGAADVPTLDGLLLIIGIACHTKALVRLCHRTLAPAGSALLLAGLPLGVTVAVVLSPPAFRPLPIFVAAAGLMFAQMLVIRQERGRSRALQIINATNGVVILMSLVYIARAVFGPSPPVTPAVLPLPPYMPPLQAMINDFLDSIILTFSISVVFHERQQAYIASLSTTDQLTGVLNRRGVLPLLELETRRARDRQALSVAVLDIDHFKRVNDNYGHEAGDAVLVGFADAVTALCRAGDVLGRWGGEEFLLLMPNTGATSALTVVHRIQAMLPDHLAGRVPCIVTFSAGIATVHDHLPTVGIDSLIARADKCLYAAKVSRNCVVSDGEEFSEAAATRLAAAH